MTSLLTRRRLLLAGLTGAAALATGCAVRVRTANSDGTPFDDARRSEQAQLRVARDGYALVEADWTDAARRRAVPVRLYLPLSGNGPRPLVLFSHGLGGSRRGYSYLGSHFARHGVASLHVQHVGSDRALWGGSPFELATRMAAAARDGEAVSRVADLRFALDRMLALSPDDPLFVPVDRRRVVAAGHSYGANTALLMSGAQVMRDGSVVDLRDARVAAAILLSAPPFYGESLLDPILRPVTVPTLHVTATADDIRIPGYASGVDDRIAVFEATGSQHKTLAVFEGGSHSIFTDRSTPGGPELNAQVKRATQELALAFMDSAFDRRHDALARWRDRHRGIVARFTKLPAVIA
jgi:predicted dienelactone hydrolase